MQYSKIRTVESVGNLRMELECVRDLDQAMEQLCELHHPKTPEEEDALLDLCPYFAVIWASARGLSEFIAERKSLWKGKNGIELGCGLALPSLVAAKLGAHMTATDFHPHVETWVKTNANLNQVELAFQQWNWTSSNWVGIHFDFVLASDVLYESRHARTVVEAMTKLIAPDGVIYLSDPGRGYLQSAVTLMSEAGFSHQVHAFSVLDHPMQYPSQKRTVFVYEFQRTLG